jgi:hypothetical protein
MTTNTRDHTSSSSRRRFLLRAVGLTTAGLALGGGAAWAKQQADDAATAEALAAELRAQLAAASNTNAALDASAAALQQRITALQGQLATLTGQNAQLASSLSAAQAESADLKTQLASAQEQLSAANELLGKFKLLIALYDQLENIGLDALVRAGLSAAASALAAVLGVVPLLKDGLLLAHTLLGNFENLLPDFHTAMTWLGSQIVNFKLGLYAVETAAQRTLHEALTGLITVFSGFVKFILDHLPFNIGADVRETLAATQDLLLKVEAAADDMSTQVLDRISKYVGDGPQNWKRTLITPLRDKALTPAANLLAALAEADAAFTTALDEPVTAALDQRAQIRAQIEALRTANQI